MQRKIVAALPAVLVTLLLLKVPQVKAFINS